MVEVDSRRLRYFVAVATELNFGRAAAQLHVAQPSLSQQIKQLEAALGAELFERTTRSVALTPAGELLLARIPGMLAELDSTILEVQRLAHGEQGTIRLGFIGSATYGLMPRIARIIKEQLPLVELDLRGEQMSATLAKGLKDGSLDVAVLRPHPELDGLEHQHLAVDRVVVAMPEGHPMAGRTSVRLTELANERFVSYPIETSAVGRLQRQACQAAGFEPQVHAVVTETSALVTFVAAALGVALVPENVQLVGIHGVRYLPLDPPLEVPLLMACRGGASETLAHRVTDMLAAMDAQSV